MRSDLPPLPQRADVVTSIVDLVGDTPFFLLRRVDLSPSRARVLAKAEHLSPGGSVKDRICLAMIEAAERDGRLKHDGTVIEATSGNTGIGLALVCRAKGYRCVLTMPASMSLERRQLLEALGAEIVLTEPEAQMDGALAKAAELAAATPGAFVPSQFDNPENPRVHAATTAREILAAVAALEPRGPVALVAGVGTGGTITGVGRALREELPGLRVVAVEPSASATISRGERGPSKIQGLAAGFVPKNFDRAVVDEVRTVRDEDAWRTKVLLARREGLLVGVSAGANVSVALDVARELGEDGLVITVLCDTGERYFSLEEHFAGPSAQGVSP
ncbi:MAG: cysteine synthase A [Myxococcales bacterium]|nr:cysteine synthase A [Myxococcales bacterium]